MVRKIYFFTCFVSFPMKTTTLFIAQKLIESLHFALRVPSEHELCVQGKVPKTTHLLQETFNHRSEIITLLGFLVRWTRQVRFPCNDRLRSQHNWPITTLLCWLLTGKYDGIRWSQSEPTTTIQNQNVLRAGTCVQAPQCEFGDTNDGFVGSSFEIAVQIVWNQAVLPVFEVDESSSEHHLLVDAQVLQDGDDGDNRTRSKISERDTSTSVRFTHPCWNEHQEHAPVFPIRQLRTIPYVWLRWTEEYDQIRLQSSTRLRPEESHFADCDGVGVARHSVVTTRRTMDNFPTAKPRGTFRNRRV